MYRRSKFLEVLLNVRQEMAREADYDVDLFAEMIRSGRISSPAAAADADGSAAKARGKTDSEGHVSSDN